MSKVDLVLGQLHRAELSLARHLRELAERHRAEQEVFHVAHILADWSDEHAHAIEELAPTHDPGVRPRGGGLPDGPADPGLLLLADLRAVYQEAAGVSVDWKLLGQAATTLMRPDLIELVRRCSAETARQLAWADGQLKQSAPQVLAT